MSWLVAQILLAIIFSLAGPNAQDSAPSATVTGKVFAPTSGLIADDAGSILPGVPQVDILAHTSGRGVASISDSSGLYRLSLVPGTYSLEYRLAGFETQKYDDVVVDARAHAVRDVVLKAVGPPVGLMAPGTITGEIKYHDGSPGQTTFVTVDTISHPDWSWKVRTDRAGRYRVQVPPGDYAVWYWHLRSPGDAPGWGNQARHHLTLESGEPGAADHDPEREARRAMIAAGLKTPTTSDPALVSGSP